MTLQKRSLTLQGHRTSLALEPEFWSALEACAARQGVRLPDLVARIDRERAQNHPGRPLASAVRVYALNALNGGG